MHLRIMLVEQLASVSDDEHATKIIMFLFKEIEPSKYINKEL